MRHGRLLVLLLLPACRYNPLLPDLRTPADFAKEIAPRCRGFTDESAAPLFSPSAVDSVEPAYAHVQSGPSDREARLRGARIHVRPMPGLSRESIARSLECHESRVVLGTGVALADDPYTLAGRWLEINVDSEGDGFVVKVEPEASGGSSAPREILERAKRFAAGAGPAR
jgi:hypothetical protein